MRPTRHGKLPPRGDGRELLSRRDAKRLPTTKTTSTRFVCARFRPAASIALPFETYGLSRCLCLNIAIDRHYPLLRAIQARLFTRISSMTTYNHDYTHDTTTFIDT